MVYCRIIEIREDSENSKLTQYKLEIIEQPKKGGFFFPLFTLSKLFTVSRTPEASGISGMWRFYTPEDFQKFYGSYEIEMESWQPYKRSMLLRFSIILGGILLVLGSCSLLVTKLLN